MKFKKLAIFSFLILILGVCISFAQADDFEATIVPKNFAVPKNFEVIAIKQWNEGKDNEPNAIKDNQSIDITASKAIILHNNGNPIKTNIFKEKQGNELFAVSIYTIKGIEYKSYYIANTPTVDIKNTIYNVVLDKNKNDAKLIENYAKNSHYVRNYTWDIYDTSIGKTTNQEGRLTTSLDILREKDNVNINDVKGSVWSVNSTSQLMAKSPIKNQTTLLDVDYSNQSLYSWDPSNGFKYILKGIQLNDLSNKIEKYGKWQLKSKLWIFKNLNVNYAIRLTNIPGDFNLKLNQINGFSASKHNTGTILVNLSDR
jgi:hypothetical protein